MYIRTPGAVGIKPKEPLNPPPATQALPAPTLPLLVGTERNKRVAARLPLAAAVAVGNPARLVLVVQQVAVVVAAGAVAGRAQISFSDQG